MTIGRPNKGVAHVDTLEGAQAEKLRLRAILSTLSGELSVDEACAKLGIERPRFQELRKQALQGALDALVPRQVGRPRKETSEANPELEELRQTKAELEEELEAMRVRVQLAAAFPSWPHKRKKGAPQRDEKSER